VKWASRFGWKPKARRIADYDLRIGPAGTEIPKLADELMKE
jgi:hypothetical protein